MIIQEHPAQRRIAFRSRLIVRALVGMVCLGTMAGVAAPYLDADAFRGRIQQTLEKTLGRRIEIQKIHFSLFSGPGFTLDDVTIAEDPQYGLEPFAYVPRLEVRVRLDKLMLGQIRPLGLRLVDASLNLVKSEDGTWNAVALVERLGSPRPTPLNFFPAVQISNARIDFKLGVRKTTFYLTETGISIYPESSGKIYFRFAGSPARTDRAGNGFGHLNGTANWYLRPAASGNQLEADVNLEPSNLSELATLLQGQDLGVHGNVSAHVLISGPFSNLQAAGDLQLDNVHRWDLLPSPGDSWRVRFQALANLQKHSFELTTQPLSGTENPVTLQLRASDFMTHPSWSVFATMHKAPLASLLPLAKRMGMALPVGLQMDGALDGVIGFSSQANRQANLQASLQGGLVITNALANIPNVPPLRSALANITISGNRIHIDPAILQSDTGGTLRAGGDIELDTQKLNVNIGADQCSIAAFKQTTNAWFGSPKELALLGDGNMTGQFHVSFPSGLPVTSAAEVSTGPNWSGQAQFSDTTLNLPGVSLPVTQASGKFSFDEGTLDLARMEGLLGELPFSASYHYAVSLKHAERLRLNFEAADLSTLEADLMPTLSDNGLLSRLPFSRRTIPNWLANRNMEGDVAIAHASLNQEPLGPLAAHFIWQGAGVQIAPMQLNLVAGKLTANGNVLLSARLPHYHFSAQLNGYAWNGGTVDLRADADTSGVGLAAFERLDARGRFSGEQINVTGAGDPLQNIEGQFHFSFDGTMPALKLTDVNVHQDDGEWSGAGSSRADGKLHLDLSSGERQLHLVADLSSNRRN